MNWFKIAQIIKIAQINKVEGCEACNIKHDPNRKLPLNETYTCGEHSKPRCNCETIKIHHNHECGECTKCKPDKWSNLFKR